MLTLFFLYVFLVWIFSWRDLVQITATEASCVLYIICSQYITFEQVTLCSAYCVWFFALLASPYAVLLRTCPYLFWLNLIVQFTSEFSLSCADLCKVSTEDGDHVISQMVVLIAEIEGNCFYTIFSIVLVWRSSGLLKVSRQITGYVSLRNQTPLHVTLSKLVFTSHCLWSYYIMICPVLSAYTIGVVLFA